MKLYYLLFVVSVILMNFCSLQLYAQTVSCQAGTNGGVYECQNGQTCSHVSDCASRPSCEICQATAGGSICYFCASTGGGGGPVVSIIPKIVLTPTKEFKELHCFVKLDNILFQVGGFYTTQGSIKPELGVFNGQVSTAGSSTILMQYYSVAAKGPAFQQKWIPQGGGCIYEYDAGLTGFSYNCVEAGAGSTPFTTFQNRLTFCEESDPKCFIPLPFPPNMCLQPGLLPASGPIPTFLDTVYSTPDGSKQIAYHLTGIGSQLTRGVLTGGYHYKYPDGTIEHGFYSLDGINVIYDTNFRSRANLLVSSFTATTGRNVGKSFPVIDFTHQNFIEHIFCDISIDKKTGLYNFKSFTKHCERQIIPVVSSLPVGTTQNKTLLTYNKLLSFIPTTQFNQIIDIYQRSRSTDRENLICQYGGYCKVDDDCYPGNYCKTSSPSHSKCLPNLASYKTSKCLSNWNSKGQQCNKDSDCCDPGAFCNDQIFRQCQQPTIGSKMCINPKSFANVNL